MSIVSSFTNSLKKIGTRRVLFRPNDLVSSFHLVLLHRTPPVYLSTPNAPVGTLTTVFP